MRENMVIVNRALFAIVTVGIPGNSVSADSMGMAAMQYVHPKDPTRLVAQAVYWKGNPPRYEVAMDYVREIVPSWKRYLLGEDRLTAAIVEAGQYRIKCLNEDIQQLFDQRMAIEAMIANALRTEVQT
jgi:hypothetical protein